VVSISDESIGRAADVLRRGGLIGLPTETVYGLAADATNDTAVSEVFRVKARPSDHPLILHLARVEALNEWVVGLSGAADMLARECWPGPLTLVVGAADSLPRRPLGGRNTAAIRIPAHDAARAVIDLLGRPVAAPSANQFGRVSPTTADHVCDDLGPDVSLVLDGGPTVYGIESTIVDTTGPSLQILRHGAIPVEDLEMLVGHRIEDADGPARAPGMLGSHYAPSCDVLLATDLDEAASLGDACERRGKTWRLLPTAASLPLYAATLYDDLRTCDNAGVDVIVAVLPPPQGLGRAIRDRLMKAAAPR